MTKPKILRPPPAVNSRSATPERWTKQRMADLLRELGASHSVAGAAKAVGMSRQSAYRLRARLKGQPFDIAWEAAFQHGYDALHQAALERALHGIELPVYHRGEVVGTRRHFDERLTCFLLGARNRKGAQQLGRFTAASEFWSERWDAMLVRVEEGAVVWEEEADIAAEGDPETEAMKGRSVGAPGPPHLSAATRPTHFRAGANDRIFCSESTILSPSASKGMISSENSGRTPE